MSLDIITISGLFIIKGLSYTFIPESIHFYRLKHKQKRVKIY